jgi:hypothetical protein
MSKACEEAFQTLKDCLTTAPVLAQPNIHKDFDVYCDASRIDLGCVLMQEGRVVAYTSRQLKRQEDMALGRGPCSKDMAPLSSW